MPCSDADRLLCWEAPWRYAAAYLHPVSYVYPAADSDVDARPTTDVYTISYVYPAGNGDAGADRDGRSHQEAICSAPWQAGLYGE